jgi:hypothetical protein
MGVTLRKLKRCINKRRLLIDDLSCQIRQETFLRKVFGFDQIVNQTRFYEQREAVKIASTLSALAFAQCSAAKGTVHLTKAK